jgi:hypothetical protein
MLAEKVLDQDFTPGPRRSDNHVNEFKYIYATGNKDKRIETIDRRATKLD